MVKSTFSASDRRGLSGVFSDLYHGFKMHQVWRHFAWDEIQNRYRRSILGITWIGLSYLFFVVVIVFFFRNFGRTNNQEFLPHVAVGFATFGFLVGNITDGCDVFRTSTTWIKSTSLPYSIYIYKSIFRSIFTFTIQFILAFILIWGFQWRPSPGNLMIIPALLILLINAVAIQLLFGLVATRYNDLAHLVGTVTRIFFFATPIMWMLQERGGIVKKVALYNPMTHYIEIVRAPLLGTQILEHSWTIVICLTIMVWGLALIAGSFMMKRLPYWL